MSSKLKSGYPDRVPVIVEKDSKSHVPDIDRKKFLAPNDITVAKFLIEIRKHVQLDASDTIWIFVGGRTIPQPAMTMAQLYENHKDEDGFLYIVYSGENTFGAL